MKTKAPTLVITMQGGVVQDVCSDQRQAVVDFFDDILIVDYDTDSFDEDSRKEIRLIPQGDGTTAEGYVSSAFVSDLDWEVPEDFEPAYPDVEEWEPEVCPLVAVTTDLEAYRP